MGAHLGAFWVLLSAGLIIASASKLGTTTITIMNPGNTGGVDGGRGTADVGGIVISVVIALAVPGMTRDHPFATPPSPNTPYVTVA